MIAAVGAFARVVKQQSEAQQGQVLDLRKNFGQAALRGIFVRGEFGELFDGDESVLVHGIAMVEVRNNQAKNVSPFREHGLQESGIVHHAQRRGGVRKRENAVQRRPQWLARARNKRAKASLACSTRRSVSAAKGMPWRAMNSSRRRMMAGSLVNCAGDRKKDALVRNREFRVGEPRAPIAKMRRQRSFASLVQIERAAGLLVR